MRTIVGLVATLLIGGSMAQAQHQYPTADVPSSEPEYIAKIKTAAPEQIVSKASIVMMQDGKLRELQAGSNGFTCLIGPDGTPLCADQNGMEWVKSIGAHRAAEQDWLHLHAGRGDRNNQPRSASAGAAPSLGADQSSRHGFVGPRVREMIGYRRNLDVADPSQPYVMFPGTAYEHLMLLTKWHAKGPRHRLGPSFKMGERKGRWDDTP
jgi:hypothetical protein